MAKITKKAKALAELDREMDLGTYNFTLVIPNHFQHDVLAGRQPEIQLNIDATIMSEIPLPIPRWVMSSPIHMSSTVPAVSDITMRKTCGVSNCGMTGWPALAWKDLKRKT